MNLADAKVAQRLIPVEDFERGVAFYRDVMRSCRRAGIGPYHRAPLPRSARRGPRFNGGG